MLYVIQSGEAGPVKIGITNDVKRRVTMLSTGCPDPLRVLRVVEGGEAQERALHQSLAAHRLRGEWFAPVPEVLAAGSDLPPVHVAETPVANENPFVAWRKANGVAGYKIVEQLGISRFQLSRWENGLHDPTLAFLHAVKVFTNGEVTPDAWVAWWAARQEAR